MGTDGIRISAPRRLSRRALGLPAVLAAAWAMANFAGCGRDFQNPFLPQSDGYAGEAWSRDGNGNGVADSVEKYAPDCAAGPSECLRKAQANAERVPAIPVQTVKVPDMSITLLTEGDDRMRVPSIAWTPPDATDKGYTLSSDKPDVVRVVGGSLELLRQGEAKITLTSDDGGKRDTFKVKVTILIPCGTLYPCDDGDDSEKD
jgi:hypothetical protein